MNKYMKNMMIALLAIILPTAITACSSSDSSEAVTPELTISVNNQEISSLDFYGNRGYKMVAIRSTVDFELSIDASWCQLSNRSGSATLTDYQTLWLKISVDKNESNANRTATLTATAGSLVKRLTINQNGTMAADDYGFEVAMMALQNMGNGVNIGNTLDANGDWISSDDPKDYETSWGNPQVTLELIAAYKNAGFKAIRLPVTWRQHIDNDGNIIHPQWMARVREVVDYIIDAGMYCILNVHHDTGGADQAWLRAWQDEEYLEEVEHKFNGLWTNIANEFNSYGDKLLFEGYNEMLDGKLRWTDTDEKGYAALNRLAQDFVNTVRATGGNNAHRNLIVNTYSADGHEKSLAAFVIPSDPIANHLIVEIHNYTPGEFVGPETTEDVKQWNNSYAAEVDEAFALLEQYITSQGIPAIIGEFGCNDKVPEAEQVKYVNYFLSKTKALGVPAFHWFDLINRNSLQWNFPEVKNELVK